MAKLRPLLLILGISALVACGPPPAKLPNAAYYLGDTHLRRGELDQAVAAFKVFISDPGANGQAYLPNAYYLLAFTYYKEGRFEDTITTLNELEKRYPNDMDAVQVWTLRGDASRQLGNRVEALQEYDEAWRYSGQLDRVRLEKRIESMLGDMSVEELTQVQTLVTDPLIQAMVSRHLVAGGGSLIAAQEQALGATGEAEQAAAPVPAQAIPRTEERREMITQEKAKQESITQPETASATTKSRRTLEVPPPAPEPEAIAPEVPTGPAKVVCLAPLSGSDSSTGKRVCDSVTSAFGSSSERIVATDAGETADSARTAWETVIDPSVVAAVVWLPSQSTDAVAPLAETGGVPTILLSNDPAAEGRYVREWRPGRSAEVGGLTSYMIGTVRVRRFGIFYPDTPSGNDYLDRFNTAVRNNGGELVGKQFYRTGDLDERPLMDTLKKWRKRDVNVDAVFVPDQLTNVETLVTAINQEYPDVIVLGLSSWNGTTTPLQAFTASGTDSVAFDVGSALYGAVVGGGANTRSDVEERLRHVNGSTTASSAPPTIFRLQNGATEPVGG